MSDAQPDYIISDLWPLIVGIDEVQIDPSNAMTHDEANLDQIAGSLNKHKQRKPIVINRTTGTIEAGNGTLLAARRLGWDYIAAVGEEDDAQTAVSYGIADNAVASQAWDWERLKKHLDTFDAPGEVPGVDDGLLDILERKLGAEVENPYLEWRGMPEFKQEDKTAYQSIHIHFKDQEDVDSFATLVGQKITEKTRSLWYPKAEQIDMVSEKYYDET